MTDNGDGTVTALLNVADDVTYTLLYFPMLTEDAMADYQAETVLSGRYIRGTGSSCVLNRMVPGEAYWVGICEGNGDPSEYAAYVPQGDVQPFTLFSNELIAYPVLQSGTKTQNVDSFCLEDIQNTETACNFFLALKYNNPGEEYKGIFHLVLETPNGIKSVGSAGYAVFTPGEGVFAGQTVALDSFFADMQDYLGEIPLGDYTISLYVDGEVTGTLVIPVLAERAVQPTPVPASEGALTITGIVPNGDGTYTLTWAGGKEGNVTISYWPTLWNQLKSVTLDSSISREIELTRKAKGGSYLLDCLVPGEEYEIIVTDKAGTTVRQVLTAEKPDRPDELKLLRIDLSATPVLNMGGLEMEVSEFSLAEMTLGLIDHGLVVSGAYYSMPETKDYRVMIALTCANRIKLGIPVGTLHVEAETDKTEFNLGYVDLNSCITTFLEKCQSLPDSGWSVEFYLDSYESAWGSKRLKVIQ